VTECKFGVEDITFENILTCTARADCLSQQRAKEEKKNLVDVGMVTLLTKCILIQKASFLHKGGLSESIAETRGRLLIRFSFLTAIFDAAEVRVKFKSQVREFNEFGI
jgi:hypothetical protein